MLISIGISTADDRVIDKTDFITFYIENLQCEIYNECNIMNPVFLLSYNSAILSYNYIKAWNRYYYIKNLTLAPAGRMYLECAEDVLMSNKDDILNLNAYCSRCETSTERYVVDDKVPTKITNYRTHIPFSGSFIPDTDGFCYLLTVKGGKLNGSN